MLKNLKKVLPWVAFAALAVAALLLVLGSGKRADMMIESPQTRAAGEAALAVIASSAPADPGDLRMISAGETAREMPYIVSVWLFDPTGKKLWTAGQVPPMETLQDGMTAETGRILSSLPDGALDEETRLLLQAASAVQAEGEHNDVFHHLVQTVPCADGSICAVAAVAYEVSPEVGRAPAIGYILSILGLVFCVAVYGLALPLWVWLDAKERREPRRWVWTIFVLLGNLVALIAYLLVRVPLRERLDEE